MYADTGHTSSSTTSHPTQCLPQVNHRYFEIALMLVIVGNVVALATYHYDMGPDQRHRLDQASP
jgi:hypothetical protein